MTSRLWHSPALMPHIERHDPQALGFDFTRDAQRVRTAHRTAFRAVKETRKDQPVAMDVGTHQQHGAADRVQPHQIRAIAQVFQQDAPMVSPAIAIEGGTAPTQHAMRMHDVTPGGEQTFDQIGRIFDDVHVEPEHPVMLAEGAKQQMVASLRQRGAARQLDRLVPARQAEWDAKTKIPAPDFCAVITRASLVQSGGEGREIKASPLSLWLNSSAKSAPPDK